MVFGKNIQPLFSKKQRIIVEVKKTRSLKTIWFWANLIFFSKIQQEAHK